MLDLNINLKNIKCKGHLNAVTRPHRAYNEEEIDSIITYAQEKGSKEMECLVKLMFNGAMRI